MASGNMALFNMAEIANGYTFKNTNAMLNNVSLKPEYSTRNDYTYDETSERYVAYPVKTYHTVCPLYTYFHANYCYSEPINQLILTVIPEWENLTERIKWTFSILHGSSID